MPSVHRQHCPAVQVLKEEHKQSLCALADRCQEKRKETKVMQQEHFTLAQLI